MSLKNAKAKNRLTTTATLTYEENNGRMKIFYLNKDGKKGFLYLDGINRPIIPGQVTKLARSLLLIGCVRPVTVARIKFLTGKEEQYIIDGQHLFNGLIRNNMDIPYVEIKISSKQELVEIIALLNASSKSWTMVDYITAWSSIHDDYKKLRNYYNIYDFDISILAAVLSGSNGNSGGTVTKRIKCGEFRIINEKDNVQLLDYLTDILKIAPRMNRFENRYLCSEYITFLKNKGTNYNHACLLQNLTRRKEQLVLATQEVGKLSELFEKLSNKK